jgi:hypothetical protein
LERIGNAEQRNELMKILDEFFLPKKRTSEIEK